LPPQATKRHRNKDPIGERTLEVDNELRGEFAAERRLRAAKFGATPEDRMRLRLKRADGGDQVGEQPTGPSEVGRAAREPAHRWITTSERQIGLTGLVLGASGTSGDVTSIAEITSEVLDTAVVVTVVGEIDNSNGHQLEAALGAALQRAGQPEQAGVVAVDLTRVSFLGSAGLNALVNAACQAEWTTKPLRIVVNEHLPVIRPIQLTGLESMLVLFDSVADALSVELPPDS
jgi:anti-sigma B factor antagonist